LIYFAGPSFYFLYLFFPTDNAMGQAMEDFSGSLATARFGRLPGVTAAAMAAFYYILSRYGMRGVLDLTKPIRLILMVLCFALSLFGGFRSAVIIFALICAAQFYFEGLFRTRLFLGLLLALVLGGAFVVPFANKLPLSVQRSLSILPLIQVDTSARLDAQASTEWRLEMWKTLLPQVRQYFFLGKGYALSPADLYLTDQSVRRGLARDYEIALVAGDYHSGPLSVLIPFGIFGVLGFLWLLVAGLRVLYLNQCFGDPALQNINTFLLSYFVARAVFYWVGFGAFNSEIPLFLGVLGLSVALNGGVKRENALAVPERAELRLPAPVTV
jgi:O-antigen ligase